MGWRGSVIRQCNDCSPGVRLVPSAASSGQCTKFGERALHVLERLLLPMGERGPEPAIDLRLLLLGQPRTLRHVESKPATTSGLSRRSVTTSTARG